MGSARKAEVLGGLLGVLLVFAFAFQGWTADAEPTAPTRTPRQVATLLRSGGYVVHVRHAATLAEQVDESLADLTDCSKQRKLSDLGKRQSREMGEAFRRLGIPVGRVASSPYCRCLETARLAFGRVEVNPDLISSVPADEAEAARLARTLREELSRMPESGTNTVLVGHMANLKEAVGIWPKPEGVAHVFRPTPGGPVLVGEIPPAHWADLAAE